MTDTTHIPAATARTLDGLLRERIRQSPQWAAFTYFDKEQQRWHTLSWQQIGERVGRWLAALAPARLRKGDRVAIQLRNGPDWVAAEQAALHLGLVVVPLYMDDRPDNVHYVLQDAGAKALIVADASGWERIHRVSNKPLADLQLVILLEGMLAPSSPWEHTIVQCAQQWLPPTPAPLNDRLEDPHSLATIVYTSGTTGRPKGVMLSHHNILTTAEGSGKAMGVIPQIRLLSFLPISHMFERTGGYYVPMMFGMEVTYARSIQQLADDLQEMQPHVLIAVPRIFERFYEKLNDSLAKKSALARAIFNLAVKVGWQRFLYQQGRGRWSPLLLLWPLLKQRVAAPLAQRFGGRLLLSVSGGAPLPAAIARVFIGLGINVIQGYGLTECSPVISANRTHCNDPASVGQPIDGIEVRVGDNDELQVKGTGVMLATGTITRPPMTP
jgi:long-chain acyl-CoA synthetase